jgi:choline-sulfatase
MSPPNIVVVMADQHRADFLGCAGAPGVHTPTLDRLAGEGARFSRVLCQGPLCMPARASFLTERYARDHGVYTNWAEVDPSWPTYVRAMRDAGYHTVQIGKAHLYRFDSYHAAHTDELAPRIVELGFAEVHESGDKFSTGEPNAYTDHLRERGLFDIYAQHIRDRAYQGESETGANATKRVPMWDATPVPLPLDAYFDQWQGDQAVSWIENYRGDAPFFAFVGFPGPHDPWDAPAEARARYDGVEVMSSRSTRRPDPTVAGSYGRMLKAFLHLSDSRTMDDAAIAAMRTAYAANVSVIDDAVGRIVAALDAKGVLDDTWVIYTSDHGEMAGDHGLMSKCVFYRGATRVPLIIRPPRGTAPVVVDDLVEHVDVSATLRAIAGVPACPGGEGHSLLGYLGGDRPAPRDVSVSENWGFALFETDRYKLVVDEDTLAPCQLIDLAADEDEDVNLIAEGSSASVVDDLMAAYVRPFFRTPPARPHPSPFAARDGS